MVIDLSRFANKEYDDVIPVINGIGWSNSRKFSLPVEEDGWYKIHYGDNVASIRKATPLEILKKQEGMKSYIGYPVGEEIIPLNFDNFCKKGYGESFRVFFLNEPPWDIVKFVQGEDKNFYSCGSEVKANRTIINQVKEAFEKNLLINGIKGVTPEIRYVFLLHRMQRDAFLAAKELETLHLKEEERQKRIEEFRATFPGRLEKTIEDAGGTLVRFSKKGSNYTVVWKINGQRVNSTIKDDFGIMELGFCASGEDKRHTLSSAIKLAQDYYEHGGSGIGGLYITRE